MMKNLTTLLYLILFFCPIILQARGSNELLRGKISDTGSGKALPFAHIYYRSNSSIVSTSNQEGLFNIPYRSGDTLVISFIGYRSRSIAINSTEFLEIRLKPLSVAISTIEIEEESDFLYELLSRSKNSNAYYSKIAKTYFFQETSLDSKTAEMQNRKLANALRTARTKEEAKETYEGINKEFEDISKDYFASVKRGKDMDEFKRWNDEVRSNLGIDNFEIFSLSEEELDRK